MSQPPVVIDYELLTSGTTWYVSGLVNVTNLQIEGTAVVKFTNSASARINVSGAIDCQTGPYRPAVLTSNKNIQRSTTTSTNYVVDDVRAFEYADSLAVSAATTSQSPSRACLVYSR